MQNFHDVLLKLNGTYRKIAGIQLSKIGLTKGQPKVLDFVVLNEGCIQNEIAQHCNIEPATVSSLLSIMEKKGLLCRSQNANNRRILNISLTDDGIEQQKHVQEIFRTIDEVCFRDFSVDEIIETKRLLSKIQINLDEKETNNA